MNQAETAVAKFLEERGWTVCRNGWPDLLAFQTYRDGVRMDNSRTMAIEVKHGRDKLSDAQKACHQVLARAGIPVHVIRPDDLAAAANKRGALMFSTRTVREIKSQIDALEKRMKSCEEEISEYRRSIEACLIAFDYFPVTEIPTAPFADLQIFPCKFANPGLGNPFDDEPAG